MTQTKGVQVMLTRFDPVGDFDRFSSELLGALSRRASSMPIDAYRHEDQWVVVVDLPGVDASTIDLTVDRNVLRIEANRDWRPSEGDLVLAAERPRGTFSRQLMLSEDIDTASIKADYRDGVLTVWMPVAETAKPKKVAIGTQQGEAQAVEAGSKERTEHAAA
jgi:HSP20 family protein